MKKLVIIGVGGFGRDVAWLVERVNRVHPTWNLIGFVDDNTELHGKIIGGYPVLGPCHWLDEHKNDVYAICAVGASKTRKKLSIG